EPSGGGSYRFISQVVKSKRRIDMAGGGSALTRALRYFKEAELEEAEGAFELVKRTLATRQQDARRDVPAPVRKARKPRTPKTAPVAPAPNKAEETLADA